MNLKALDNQELVRRTRRVVAVEKRVTLKVLHHLREIELRRTYVELNYSSLFEFATKSLGYSAAAAQRRIDAMRLLTALPEVEEKVKTGELQLSTLASAQSFFKTERKDNARIYSKEEKREVVDKLLGKSTREAERVFLQLSPEHKTAQLRDKEKIISLGTLDSKKGDQTQIQFVADEELTRLLKRVKELVACPQDMNPNYNTIIKKLTKFYLEKKDPARVKNRESCTSFENPFSPKKAATSQVAPTEEMTPAPESKITRTAATVADLKKSSGRSRYISIDVKRTLFRRSGSQCEFKNGEKRCENTYALQVEHVIPFAKGGSNTLENLKLFCPTHNQWAATQVFGMNFIERFRK